MYSELIKWLRECASGECFNCSQKGNASCPDDLMKQAADAIEELQKQLREEKVDNVNLTGWLAEEHAKVEEQQKTHDELIDFLAFLFNHIPPNEMEHYWTMFHCLDVPTCGESEGE